MKLVSFSVICLILVSLFIFAQYQDNSTSNLLVAGTGIEILSKELTVNISALPWAKEEFSQNMSIQKVNYINYWAKWCEPCLTEIPQLLKMTKNNDNLNLIFVNVDNKSNSEVAKQWWDNNIGQSKSFYPNDETSILRYTRGLPYHQIYDKNKNLVSHFTGDILGRELQVSALLKIINSN